jgi:anti-sigma factor RsiW
MTADDEPIGETDLLAFVDGHLDPQRRRAVEEHLARHPHDAARVAIDGVINAGLRQIFESYYREEPPERLRRPLASPRRQRWPLRPTLTRIAAGLALLVGGGAGGWWVSQKDEPIYVLTGVERFANGPLQPAALSTAAPPGNAAAPKLEPASWLAEGLRGALRVPDLSSAGLQLVSQSLVGSPEHPALQLTYENRQGGRIYLFLQPRWDDLEPRLQLRESGGRGVVYWADGPVVFALAGDAGPADLRRLADMAQQAPAAGRQAPARAVTR